MSVLKKDKKIQKNIARVRTFSGLVEKRLDEMAQKSDEARISRLTVEELQDFEKILQITSYLLCKHEHKKEVHSLLKDFVSMIGSSTDSLGALNDNIDELVLSADDAIKRIKDLQSSVSENFTVDSVLNSEKPPQIQAQNGGNNLTNPSTPAYTQGYQAKPTLESGQVI